MGPFDLFPTTSYTFLELDQKVDGNVIKSEHEAEGIAKIRSGITQTDYGETSGSSYVENTSKLKIKLDEPFIALVGGDLVGHGIRLTKNGSDAVEYRIDGQSEGYDFDAGVIEFYTVTLKRESIATWDGDDLPLS